MKNATPQDWRAMRSIQRNGIFGHFLSEYIHEHS